MRIKLGAGNPVISILLPHSNYKHIEGNSKKVVHKTDEDYRKEDLESEGYDWGEYGRSKDNDNN